MTWSNNIKVDAIGLAAEVVDLRRELEQQATLLGKGSEREARLLAENAELRAKLNDPARLHAHCVRYLTDAQVAHLFGERMTEIVNSRDKLEAENAALREDKERLENYIAKQMHKLEVENTGQEAQIEQLETENAALREYKKKASERLRYLAQFWNPNFDFESDEIGKHIVAGDYDKMIKAIDQSIKAINAARKEAQP